MKKFNLMILGLFVSVLMFSLVSAGITGYFVKEGGFIGEKIVSSVDAETQTFVIDGEEGGVGSTFETEEGIAEVVGIKKTNIFRWRPQIEVQVSNAEAALTEDDTVLSTPSCTDSDGGSNYYVKGKINLEELGGSDGSNGWDYCSNGPGTSTTNEGIYVLEWSCCGGICSDNELYECPNGCSNGACIGSQTPEHTHLSDFDISGRNLATFIRNVNNTNNVYVELPCYSGTVPIDAGFNLDFRTPNSTDRMPVIQWKHHNYNKYYIGFWDPDQIIDSTGGSWGYVYCAKIEPTQHNFGEDY